MGTPQLLICTPPVHNFLCSVKDTYKTAGSLYNCIIFWLLSPEEVGYCCSVAWQNLPERCSSAVPKTFVLFYLQCVLLQSWPVHLISLQANHSFSKELVKRCWAIIFFKRFIALLSKYFRKEKGKKKIRCYKVASNHCKVIIAQVLLSGTHLTNG